MALRTALSSGSSSAAHVAYLCLGSNLGDRVAHIQQALTFLGQQPQCRVTRVSFLYQTPPAYVTDQPPFLNCACRVETTLPPVDLLRCCKTAEAHVGRSKSIRNGPREVDVDIAFYDDLTADFRPQADLIVPHERAHERAFVLGPVCDICDPSMQHPGMRQPLRALLAAQGTEGLQPVLPLGGEVHALGSRTLIMGILNVTPDSFSDGGQFGSVAGAVTAAERMAATGADILDIGGQSTRPGAALVEGDEECRRVLPVIRALRAAGCALPLSVDTFRSEVAEAAIAAGASLINDVSGGQLDPRMVPLAARLGVPICLMHYRGDPATMARLTHYEDVVEDVAAHLEALAQRCEAAGVLPWNILLDPGLGFAKTAEQSLECLRHADRFLRSNAAPATPGRHALLLGPSRKSFLGHLLRDDGPTSEARRWGTAAACCAGVQRGADVLRVHDVPEMAAALRVADAVHRPRPAG